MVESQERPRGPGKLLQGQPRPLQLGQATLQELHRVRHLRLHRPGRPGLPGRESAGPRQCSHREHIRRAVGRAAGHDYRRERIEHRAGFKVAFLFHAAGSGGAVISCGRLYWLSRWPRCGCSSGSGCGRACGLRSRIWWSSARCW